MFRKILIANRGEIALRVIRACRELGVGCAAVYSDADRDALHVTAADEAYRLGPSPPQSSYLDVDRLLEAAKSTACDAVHPGYGFLAENAAFARRCEAAGLAFIGPSADGIERMGDKIAARAAAEAAGVPAVPGSCASVPDESQVRRLAKKFGYPLAIKAAAGGGGKGLKIAHDAAQVDQAFALAVKEGTAYFGDRTVYVERYLARPKHVEVQILGDKRGRVVHLGERDCSLQRRHQKLVEEAPANVSPRLRQKLLRAGVKVGQAIEYDSAGTIEFLVEGERFYFLEMNTRIQVEHTVTEMVWGIDLVKAQIRVAAGEPLWFAQDDLTPRGNAIECRINAESPAHDFHPSPGRIIGFRAPGGPGIRVDTAAYAGLTIPREYDSLIAKLVAWGQDRDESRRRMLRALGEFSVDGVDTTIQFLRLLLQNEAFVRGDYATPTVDEYLQKHADLVGAAYAPPRAAAEPEGYVTPSEFAVEVNDKRFIVRAFGLPPTNAIPGGNPAPVRRLPLRTARRIVHDHPRVESPMHGVVVEVRVAPGDRVADGQVVAVIEAMKIMNEIVAHRRGIVASVDARPGQTVETGASIVTLTD